ncbi:MAG: thioredoxin [Paenibacillus sp.]|jgi:thioredoxin-like negative regulator of GroEL|nr:thioredoxin [Paenibacillus sp.]
MVERTEAELVERAEDGGRYAVFLYTPLCGTCKLAERMLDILQVMRPDFTIDKANVNRMPLLVNRWRIESVPCLLQLEQGQVKRKMYAFASIDNVYRFLEPMFPKP